MKTELRKSELLTICYPNDWHWVLSLEYLSIKNSSKMSIEVFDFSQIGEFKFKHTLKNILHKNSIEKNMINYLNLHDIRITRFHTKNYLGKYLRLIIFYKKIVNKIDISKLTSYNSIVERTGSLNIDLKVSKRVVISEEIRRIELDKVLSGIDFGKFKKIVTVNGRFTKNSSIVRLAKEKELQIRLLEFGSSRTKIQVYRKSPHSMHEIQNLINTMWNKSENKLREKIAKQYMSQIKRNSDIANIGWRIKMQPGFAPKVSNKKRCTFFASTEAEYAGVGDILPKGYFKNQVEAFRYLCEYLDPNVWEIFLRRHPQNPMSKIKDPEFFLWKEFEFFKNVTIIEPDSIVDSLALGLSSDLCVNYCSSISMELVALGAKEVITMGPAPWNKLIPKHTVQSEVSLKAYLVSKPKPIRIEDVWPWAYYSATFGEDFSLFDWTKGKNKWELRHS